MNKEYQEISLEEAQALFELHINFEFVYDKHNELRHRHTWRPEGEPWRTWRPEGVPWEWAISPQEWSTAIGPLRFRVEVE